MRKPNIRALGAIIDEIFGAFTRMLRHGVRVIRGMSAPALLGAAVVLALIMSILPLALVLFALFMLVKIAIGICVIGCRRRRLAHPEPHP
ncbi:MAG TPA: hypothetical protein VF670_14765 [Duganella sp.]